MNDVPEPIEPADHLPEPVARPPRKAHFSVVWIVPVLAVLACLVLVVRSQIDRGPTITISFETAEGLEEGKTEVRYKNVIVGRVSGIALSADRARVIVTVDLTRNGASLAVDDTRLWVERPRVGTGGVSGIGTLLSGAYISVDVGTSATKRKHFTGLESSPAFLRDQRGRVFVLTSPDAGSLGTGSPVYYRRIQVGAVSSTELIPGGKRAEVRVFVRAPYDHYVTTRTHFWNSSGVDLELSPQGLKLNTESLATVVAGGVTFQEVDDSVPEGPVPDNATFELYEDKVAAFAPPMTDPVMAHLAFGDDTRGLAVGTSVEFHGVTLGTVTAVSLVMDPHTQQFHTEVVATLYPDRMGPAYVTMRDLAAAKGKTIRDGLQSLVDERNLHGQLRSANLILGQVYISLEFFPGSTRVVGARSTDYISVPTEPSATDAIEKQIAEIAKKINTIPFEEIGTNLRDTLKSASSVMAQVDKEIAPEARKIFQDAQRAIQSLRDNVAAPDSELQTNARATLTQMGRAAYSLRVLSEYLEQHPEALIRGKTNTSEPKPYGAPVPGDVH